MRQIGSIPDPSLADRFADYLLTKGIDARIDPQETPPAVWIRDEDQVEAARQELARFLANPEAAEFVSAGNQARLLRAEENRRAQAAQRNVVDVRQRMVRATRGRHLVNNLLIAFSVVVAIQSSFGSEWTDLVQQLTIVPLVVQHGVPTWGSLADVLHGEVWRLVTPIFLHFGVLHLLFNMMWLVDLGRRIEVRYGPWPYALLVVAIAVGSNLAQYYFEQNPNFGGMSGVIFGLFGFAWMKSRYDPWSGLYLAPNTVFLMIGWLAICFTGQLGPVANYAHAGGLLIGMAIGVAPIAWRKLAR